MNRESYSAQALATFLLRHTGLTDWRTDFLAIALNEVAETHEHVGSNESISASDCADQLTQMNSTYREDIKPVVHALTGLNFTVLWHGVYEDRTFYVEHHERCAPQTCENLSTLHRGCGWSSNAHRRALRNVMTSRSQAQPIPHNTFN